MLTFLGVALLIYGSMHFYALSKMWMALPHSHGFAATLIATGLVLTLSPMLVHLMERHGWHRITTVTAWVSYTWMGYLFLFVCLGLLLDLVHMLTVGLGLPWPLRETAAVGGVALLALLLLTYGFIEARQIKVEEVRITTPKLASGRVTIAQISDLHLGVMMGKGLLDRVIARLREIRPDVLVATGDIVDGEGDDLDVLARRFRTYTPPAGAYAVTGNHEYFAGLAGSLGFLQDAGFTVLRGTSAKAGGIVLAGVDDATVPGQVARADTREALASAGPQDFVVLLKHQPVVDSDTPFDLQLSGHVHGGQIFPFVYLTRLTYGVRTGLTELEDGRRLYVNRGAGTWGPPVRLFAPPEITLITIEGTGGGTRPNRPSLTEQRGGT